MTGASLRTATTDDAPAIAAIYAPIVAHTAISFELEPPSAEEMAGRIAATLADYPWLVAEERGALLGYAYASAHRTRAAYRSSVDVTCYVAETARRRGAGRMLYEALLSDLARRGFHAATAGITLPNPASVALHEAVGFRKVGVFEQIGHKHGAYHDVGWWQRIL